MTRSQEISDQTLRQQILQHLETLNIPLTSEQLDEILASRRQIASCRTWSSWNAFSQYRPIFAASGALNGVCERPAFAIGASLESFDWDFNRKTIDQVQFEELATGDFIRRRDNLLFVGDSGLGKSHLIQSVGRRCCVLGYRVRYVTSAELLEELTAASGDKTLPRKVRYYWRFDLLIIDEFGFEKLERREYPESSSLLYKIIDSRSRRGSTALVTNIEFKDWTDYLGDPPLAMALLDRMVDDAIIERFEGKSYRAYRAEQKAKQRQEGRGKNDARRSGHEST